MIIKRDAIEDIKNGAKHFPIVAILGPRQSGKTTLAQIIFKNHNYVSLEDLDLRSSAVNDPRTFLMSNVNEHGIILDEFQFVPELLSYIKTIVDREQKNGFFILTGSQNFLMNQAITQSLAGRVSIHTLLPLSIDELEKNNLLPQEIETMLYKGCYPAIYSKNIEPDLLYKNYLKTYIERDVRQLTNIGDLVLFQTFITLCAARIGQLLNITSLSNECGVSDNTIKRWLTILEASYVVFRLYPYHTSFGKRLVKTPKLYFYDTGIACNLLKIKEDELALHPNKGNLFESFIISDFLKWHYNHGQTPNIYFWRDKTGHEIDCIIVDGQKLTPIEIKASRTSNPRFFEGINYWKDSVVKKEFKNGFVIYGASAKQPKAHTNILSWQAINKIFNK